MIELINMDCDIYANVYIVFYYFSPTATNKKINIFESKKGKGVMIMTNEVIKKYIGKNCKISTGSFGTTVIGKIMDVNENWIEVETNKGNELVNADFVQSIKIK